ncbi:MAG: hypothetical protein H0T47_16430 [Planctomycetaceae bacterium]|nr:hypothetical protein [Planctomycetaceae bacterium]
MPVAVVTLLSIHAGLLAYAATRHSPTLNEPGHLVAGLAMWEFLDLYILNLGYLFDGSFAPLKTLTFVSATLTGDELAGEGGNPRGTQHETLLEEGG